MPVKLPWLGRERVAADGVEDPDDAGDEQDVDEINCGFSTHG